MAEIKGVEIFEVGEWNGDKYDESDLDAMVDAFKHQQFVPPLKAGHDETPGRPALGWVANLRRVGTKLIADFTHIPDAVFQVIKSRGFDRVSSEIYWDLKQGKKKFRRALKAVALLGADVPAVSSLAPLHSLFFNLEGTVKYYDWPEGVPNMTHEKLKRMDLQRAQRTAGELLDGKARLLSERSKMTYAQAFQQTVRDPENNFLVELYSGFASPHTPTNNTEATPEEAGAKLAVYATQIARAENISIADANVRAVREHPQLAAVYANLGQHKKYR